MTKNQSNPTSEIAQFVRAARQKMGFTQQGFGEKFNRTKANANAWELGRHEPSFAVLRAIADASGVPLPASVQPDFQSPNAEVIAETRPDWLVDDDLDKVTPLSPQAVALGAMFDQIPESENELREKVLAELSRLVLGAGASKQANDSSRHDDKKQ